MISSFGRGFDSLQVHYQGIKPLEAEVFLFDNRFLPFYWGLNSILQQFFYIFDC